MQISYLIPSLYSLRREGNSNNSTSRRLHKSFKNPCNSNAISGMPRIMQRLIICSSFRSRCTDIAFYLTSLWLTSLATATVLYFFCTLQRTVTGFLAYFGAICFKQHALISVGTKLTFSTAASQSQTRQSTHKRSPFLHLSSHFKKVHRETPRQQWQA